MRLRATKLASFHHPQLRASELYSKAGEIPSFHIAPAALGHARDLIAGAVIGTYNSATPAMAVGADGLLYVPAANAPVIEYDPVTRACLGARIWGVVTNLLVRSEEIDNATSWQVVGITVTANTTTAPNGQASAETLSVPAIAPATSFAYQVVACNPSTTYTFSFYVRLGTLTAADFRFAIRDDSNGAFIAQDIVPSVTLSTSTWQRVTYTFTTPVGCALVRPYIYRFASSGSGTFFAWGAQLNPGTVAPYVPTTTLAASSTADVWSITGANFNRIYNQSAVTLYAEAERDVVPTGEFTTLIDARNNTSTEIVKISYITESLAGNQVRAGNVVQAETYLSELTGIRRRRIASAFGTNDVAISANGSVPTTDTTATMPAPDRIYIGSNNGAGIINGYIRELAIFRSRRPNANLQAVTT